MCVCTRTSLEHSTLARHLNFFEVVRCCVPGRMCFGRPYLKALLGIVFLSLVCGYVPGALVCVLDVIFGAKKLTATQFSQFTLLHSSTLGPRILKKNHPSWRSIIMCNLQSFATSVLPSLPFYPLTLLTSYPPPLLHFRAPNPVWGPESSFGPRILRNKSL